MKKFSSNRGNFLFVYFILSILILSFAYGAVVGIYHIYPYQLIKDALATARVLYKEKVSQPRSVPPHFSIAQRSGEGVVVFKRAQVYPGVTLITAPLTEGDDCSLGISLIDFNDKLLHKWQIDPESIWPDSPHNDYPFGAVNFKKLTYIHGTLLLPNGDIIFNLDYFGLVRMDSDSKVIWKLPYRTHHSIFYDGKNSIWVCGSKWHKNRLAKWPGLEPPFFEDTILKVSLDGVIEREISVLDLMYNSGHEGLMRFVSGDSLHLNDVEVLGDSDEQAFDCFQAGDIMISMRRINTIAVIDEKTELIKWSLTYPFMLQHDPDFTGDGYITVFDNRKSYGDCFDPKGRGSRIIRIEPSSQEVKILYGWKKGQYFYSSTGGKHQNLPNGNMLITETKPGRIFEINPKGEIIWSWFARRFKKKWVPEVFEGTRYGMEYVNFIKERQNQ